jgi:hypothetical protein
MRSPRRPFPLVLLFGLAALLAACAAKADKPAAETPKEPEVQIAEEAQVSQCIYLKDVSGGPGLAGLISRWSSTAAQRGLEKAQGEALQAAKALGATHLVWMPRGYESVHVAGKAYRCSK